MSEMRTIENEILRVCVKDHGAELCSIYHKKEEREYLWTADPAHWGRHAPVLFPFVGKVMGGVYTYEGQKYAIGPHGFARDSAFTFVNATETEITHRLLPSDETRKVYPFEFELEIVHKLKGNCVTVEWRVKNNGDKTMYYSIGGHPAFNLDSLLGCRLVFAGMEELTCVGVDLKTSGADVEHPIQIKLDKGVYVVDEHTFDCDTMIFDEGQVKRVSLEDQKGKRLATLVCPDARSVGIWSPAGNQAPFICLEPWLGRCDNTGFQGELKDKFDIQTLEPGTCFETAYEVLIGE